MSGSPQLGLIFGEFSPPPTFNLAMAARTELGSVVLRQPFTRIFPLRSIMLASACAITTPGLVNNPPQFPEWCAPSCELSRIVKFNTPREPIKIVGFSGEMRGPSDAINTSALKRFLFVAQNSLRPGEPRSSPVSIRTITLKPS